MPMRKRQALAFIAGAILQEASRLARIAMARQAKAADRAIRRWPGSLPPIWKSSSHCGAWDRGAATASAK